MEWDDGHSLIAHLRGDGFPEERVAAALEAVGLSTTDPRAARAVAEDNLLTPLVFEKPSV